MIRNVILDIGRVLIGFEWMDYIHKLFDEETGQRVTDALWKTQYWWELDRAVLSEEEILEILSKLDDSDTYGFVLRSKGMVPDSEGRWIHFDYVPEETEVRFGAADVTGKICVIGSELKEDALADLFRK